MLPTNNTLKIIDKQDLALNNLQVSFYHKKQKIVN